MLPISSLWVLAHRRHLKCRCQAHPLVIPLLLLSATQQPRNRSRLPSFLEAVHQPHRLPVKVILALHREQSVNPPWRSMGLSLVSPSHHYQQHKGQGQSHGFCCWRRRIGPCRHPGHCDFGWRDLNGRGSGEKKRNGVMGQTGISFVWGFDLFFCIVGFWKLTSK